MSMEQVIKFDLFRTSVFETEMVDTWLSSWRHCTLESAPRCMKPVLLRRSLQSTGGGDVPIVPLK